jgi:hypothetical protein
MRACRAASAVVVLVGLSWSVSAQQTPGPYDGRYSGTMKCAPTGTYRLNGLTIQQSKFNFTFTFDRRSQSCPVEIHQDGTFNNQNCALPMSGKITGDKLEMKLKSQDVFCDVSATRQRS